MGKKVFVTGGAGFLGRGILRQIALGKLDWEVTVFSTDEEKQRVCALRYPFARYILGDVRDMARLKTAMAGSEWVVHAAAIKYLDIAEVNVAECVAVNVDGSRNVMEAARCCGVKRIVGISTDKAVQPVNTYGMTKALLERLFQEEQQYHKEPEFVCVRYGNIVGSTGSVIPLFRKQEKELGKVRITNPNMTRFWMGVDEAIEIIVRALTELASGSILIPPARAANLLDTARAATHKDVAVEIIGERPGEKKDELLLHYQESVRTRRLGTFVELLPPGSPATEESFTIASHTPRYMISVIELRELIEDAETV